MKLFSSRQSLSNYLAFFSLIISLCFFSHLSSSQSFVQDDGPRYLARIELNTKKELMDILRRSEQLFVQNNYQATDQPVALILHGPEAKVFLRGNYSENREIVDLAARLSAFGVVDIKVCEMWMGGESLDGKQLPPFVGAVPFGPAEEKRLVQKEGYVYF